MPQRGIAARARQKRQRGSRSSSGGGGGGGGGGAEMQQAETTTTPPPTPHHRTDIPSDEDRCHENMDSSQPIGSPSDLAHSAAATADVQTELKRQLHVCQLIERDVVSLLQQREQSTAAMGTISSLLNVSPNEMVRLNVGDEIFTVPLRLLLSKDGSENYFDMLFGYCRSSSSSNLQLPLLDDTGALFIDRDPATFRLILNYLRGYRMLSMLSEDQLSMLRTDARYFQLCDLMRELGDQAVETNMKFRPGPGVNPERNRFRVVYGVAVVGHRFLITGRHRITFQVTNSDYVGVGLVSDSCVSTDQEFHKTLHCCVYYMTGVFYSNFPHHRKEDGLEALEKGDYVSLMVDMNKRVAEYTLKNSTKMISIGNARKLRFAVTTKLSASVRIVPEEEARQLPLFQKRVSTDGLMLVDRMLSLGEDRDGTTQMSQSNGAGTLSSGALQDQHQEHQSQQNVAPVFSSRALEGIVRPSLSDGLGRTIRSIVLGSFTGSTLPSELNEAEHVRFLHGPQGRLEDS